MGSAPTEPCPIHGAQQTLPDQFGVSGSLGTTDTAYTTAPTSGTTAAAYAATSAVHRVVGTDGRITWVIRNQH